MTTVTENDIKQVKEKIDKLTDNLSKLLELEPSPQAIALIAACSLLGLVFVPVSPESRVSATVQFFVSFMAACSLASASSSWLRK